MVSYLTLGALASGAVAIVLLVLSIMLSNKSSLTDGERKRASMFQITSLVFFLLAIGLMTTVIYYPSIGQRYQTGSLGAAPRSTV